LYFSPKCLEFISGLKWPGNVRELQNSITRAAALIEENRKVIEAKDFKELVHKYDGFLAGTGGTLGEYKQKIYLETLERYGGNNAKAAEELGINPRTLYRFRTENKARKTPLPPQDFSQEKDTENNEMPCAPANEVMSKNKKRFDKELLIDALEQNSWSQTKTAQSLKTSRPYVSFLVKKWGIKPPGGIWGRKPDYTKEKLELMFKENNWNQTKAAAALGITQARLSALAKNRGVVAPGGIWQRREQKTGHISKEKLAPETYILASTKNRFRISFPC